MLKKGIKYSNYMIICTGLERSPGGSVNILQLVTFKSLLL